jgi:hypothetical protein
MAQSDQIDSVRVVVLDANGTYNNSVIQQYSSGKWRTVGTVLPIMSIQGLQTQLDAKLNTSDYTPGGGTPSLFQVDSHGYLIEKSSGTDQNFVIDSEGYLILKPL